jgi:hypothetical protein
MKSAHLFIFNFKKNDYPQVDFQCFKHPNDIETSSILIIESLQLMEPIPHKKIAIHLLLCSSYDFSNIQDYNLKHYPHTL